MQQYIKEALAQGQQISELLDRVGSQLEARRTSRDRVLHWMQQSYTFQQGQNTVGNLVFNVPKGFDFEAARFVIYPEIRLVSINQTADGANDVAFRPTVWFEPYSRDYLSAVDALLELTYAMADGKTRQYQNVGFFAAQAYSQLVNITNTSGSDGDGHANYASNAAPAGLVFDPFYKLERGSTLTCRVTPLYSGPKPSGNRSYEYRIRAVLEGYKRL